MTQLKLNTDRRDTLIGQIQTHYQTEFDETISPFRAEQLLELMMKTLAPAIYNQAVQDVRVHLQSKLDDLDGEVYIDPA